MYPAARPPQPEPEPQKPVGPTEEERVARWRREGFIKMGFSEDNARLALAARIDLREAERLLAAGATVVQVLRILG